MYIDALKPNIQIFINKFQNGETLPLAQAHQNDCAPCNR